MIRKIIFCIILLFSVGVNSVQASHIKGGEITWRCNGSGEFIFRLVFYRDCAGIFCPLYYNISTNAPVTGGMIFCTWIEENEISPQGPGCPTCLAPGTLSTAVEEVVYESTPISLSGTPPPTGWYFYFNECCRNTNTTNLVYNGVGDYTLRSIMYPYSSSNTSPCFDSSPQFVDAPTTSVCAGKAINFNESAFDTEMDSLVYSWDKPIGNGFPGSPYPFAAGYTFDSPLPGLNQNPLNVPAVLNTLTGAITFTSYTTGIFSTVVKVSAYRCNVLIAQIFREIQITVVGNCLTLSNTQNNNPLVQINGVSADYTATLLAGDSVSIPISATDFEANTNGAPQVLTLNARSQEFGYQFQRTDSGCLVPPCAVLSNPSIPLQSALIVNNSMQWATACSQVGFSNGCLQHQRTYMFIFKINDDMCPANGIDYKTVSITVTGPEIYPVGNSLVVSYPGITIQWYLNGVAIAGATDSIYTPIQNGIYTVLATTSSGCEMVSNAINRSITGGVSISDLGLNIIISPNPITNHQLSFIASCTKSRNTLIRLYDLAGMVIFQKDLQLQAGDQHIILEIGELSSGLYQMSLISGENKIDSKIIVE